jgi:hypothetical protein
MASCALFSQPLTTLNGAVGVLAIAVAALLWLVCPTPRLSAPLPLSHLSLAGFHVSVLGNMLGCCAIALWNYCVAAEAAAIADAVSRRWRAILSIHAAWLRGRYLDISIGSPFTT